MAIAVFGPDGFRRWVANGDLAEQVGPDETIGHVCMRHMLVSYSGLPDCPGCKATAAGPAEWIKFGMARRELGIT